MKRRNFIKSASITGVGFTISASILNCNEGNPEKNDKASAIPTNALPLVIATWDVKESTQKAWEIIQDGGSALDAVEQGCMVEEANEKGQSVGKGGLPDRDGNVTLDACIMDKNGNCGAVVYLQNITHAVSVARKVMEETPHVMLAGNGAQQFAIAQGFEPENLLTEASKKLGKIGKLTANINPL